jgi:uncharacterized protein
MNTAHFERAFDGQNQWWKFLVVIAASFLGGQMVGSIPLAAVVVISVIKNGGQVPSNILDFSALGINQNVGLVLMLLPFVVSFVAMVFLVKWLHRRSFAETINGRSKIRWSRIGSGFFVWGVLMAVYLLVTYLADSQNFVFNLQWGRFIALVVISLLLIPIQTTYEELLFRGYLPQGIAVLSRNRWFPLLLSAVLFAVLHLANPEVAAYGFWLSMPQYLLFGLLFGLASVLDDGIEIAIGAHAANNIFLSVFITNSSSALQTPAMLVQQQIDPLYDMIGLSFCALLFLVFLGLRYKWSFNLLFTKIEAPQKNEENEF